MVGRLRKDCGHGRELWRSSVAKGVIRVSTANRHPSRTARSYGVCCWVARASCPCSGPTESRSASASQSSTACLRTSRYSSTGSGRVTGGVAAAGPACGWTSVAAVAAPSLAENRPTPWKRPRRMNPTRSPARAVGRFFAGRSTGSQTGFQPAPPRQQFGLGGRRLLRGGDGGRGSSVRAAAWGGCRARLGVCVGHLRRPEMNPGGTFAAFQRPVAIEDESLARAVHGAAATAHENAAGKTDNSAASFVIR